MDEKALELLRAFNVALSVAQTKRAMFLDYIEGTYDVDVMENADYIEDPNDWCFGIRCDHVDELVKEN